MRILGKFCPIKLLRIVNMFKFHYKRLFSVSLLHKLHNSPSLKSHTDQTGIKTYLPLHVISSSAWSISILTSWDTESSSFIASSASMSVGENSSLTQTYRQNRKNHWYKSTQNNDKSLSSNSKSESVATGLQTFGCLNRIFGLFINFFF